MTVYLGLDVHSRHTSYCAEDDVSGEHFEGEVSTDQSSLTALARSFPGGAKLVCGLETGLQSNWVSSLLSSLGASSYVVDAHEVRIKSRRPNQKSDRRDAYELCEGIRLGIYRKIVYVPGPEVQLLRIVMYRRSHFVKICTMEINSAKSLCRMHGVVWGSSLSTEAGWTKLLSSPQVSSFRYFLERHQGLWGSAMDQVRSLERELEESLKPFSEAHRRLQTVDGVGRLTAAAFIAAIASPERFPGSSEVVSYLGLAPSCWDSGEREAHGHITKRGNALARGMLTEAAHHSSAPKHPLNPYFRRVAAKHGYNKAIICVAQRLVRILWRMWLEGEDFDERKLNVVRKKEVRSRTIYYQIRSVV